MPKIFGYCRVSSDEQAAHGISIEAQHDILNGYAAMSQSEIVIFEDAGYSGKNTQRPALQRMLSALADGGVSAVVVWKLDRLSRSLRDTLTMIEDIFQPAGASLVSVTESIDTSTPSGRMMLNLLASFAQLEREQDSDRVVMSHKHLARDCQYLGGHIPLGYRVDENKHYQLDPVRASIVRHVFDMYMARCGYSAILGYLNSPEIFPLTGKNKIYTKPALNFMLRNEIYAGVYLRRMGADPRHRITAPETIRIPGGVPAILSADEWQRVCNISADNSAGYKTSYKAVNVYPLSGLVRCSVCGRIMSVRHGGKARNGETERYYVCRNKCVRPARLESAENAVFTALEYFASDEAVIRQACEISNTFIDTDEKENQRAVAPLEDRLQEIARQNARIITFVKNHDNAPASMMQELTDLDKEEKLIRSRILSLRRPLGRHDVQETIRCLRLAGNIRKLPPSEQKARIQAAVSRVVVSDMTYQVVLSCHTCGGDEPGRYIEHIIER